jgi:hypothetical protein
MHYSDSLLITLYICYMFQCTYVITEFPLCVLLSCIKIYIKLNVTQQDT